MPDSPGWNRFHNERDDLDNFIVEKTGRTEELGFQFSFRDEAEILRSAQVIAEVLDQYNGVSIPESFLTELADSVASLTRAINETRQFRPTDDNPVIRHNQIRGNVQSAYRGFFDQSAKALPILNALKPPKDEIDRFTPLLNEIRSDAQAVVQSATQDIEGAANQLSLATADAKQNADSLSRLLEETRKNASEVIATSSAEKFSAASLEFERSAKRWMISSILIAAILLALTVTFAIFAATGAYKNLGTVSSTQLAIAKVAMIATIGVLLAASVRNYTTARHNQTVNQHRSNAVSSYRSLMEATTAPEHKDIILAQASAAIFAPQETGFGKAGSTSVPDLPSPIFNMLTKGSV